MSFKKRLLRGLLIGTLLLAFTGYFAFTTFLFNPLEGRYEGDLAALVPRDVDAYVARRGLAQEFRRFPPEAGRTGLVDALASGDELRASPGVQAYLESAEWEQLRGELGIDAAVAELERSLAQLPLRIDVLRAAGGRALAGAAYLPAGVPLEQADWAIYARLNWIGKLGASLLRHPGLLGLEKQGISAQVAEDRVRLSGGQLKRPLWVARLADVLVLGTSERLVGAAIDLRQRQGEDSFGQSARHADEIARRNASGEAFELFIDVPKLGQALQWPGVWPDPRAQELVPASLARAFQLSLVRELAGALEFDGGVRFGARSALSSEQMSPLMKRLYRQRGFDRAQVAEAARYAPADASLFAYAHLGIGDVLRTLYDSAEAAARSNLDDRARTVWGHQDATKLFDELDVALRDRVAFIARPNDYPDEGEQGPPHNDDPVFAWALIAWIEAPAKLTEIEAKIRGNPGQFGIQGRNPGTSGVFSNLVQGGYRVTEYWSQLVPGTGHVATAVAGDIFVISNAHRLIGQILATYYGGDARQAQLEDRGEFAALLDAGLDYGNVLVWLDPRSGAATLGRQAERWAQDGLAINWKHERARIERNVLKDSYQGRKADALTPEERANFELEVDAAARQFEQEVRSERVPVLYANYERRIAWAQMARAALFELALNEKWIELEARLIVPLDR